MTRLVILSDTHGFFSDIDVPNGDILIHAGDITTNGTIDQTIEFNQFLGTLPHPHKIVIAGNHDTDLEEYPHLLEKVFTNCIFLLDQAVVVDGLKIYGTPWQPEFNYWAFNLPRGMPLKERWDLIPEDTDVLVTHGPPYGILDITEHDGHVGCKDLLVASKRVKPKLHVFGHVHGGYGQMHIGETLFINASVCDEHYQPSNPVVVLDY